MISKKYQIFISSTYIDLIQERNIVRDSILNMHQFPIGMEQFSAADDEQWKVIKESIETSDYYILIVGKRYGSVIQSGADAGISYTEKEFNYAKSIGVPILAFIKSDEASFAGNAFETDKDSIEKLEAFTEKVKTGRLVKWFKNSFDLGRLVVTSLHNEMEKGDRPGWVRGNQVNVESKVDELLKILKHAYGDFNDEEEFDDLEKPVEEYEFVDYRFPSDGHHRHVNSDGDLLEEGLWKDGKLITGVEYDCLIHVTQGTLTFKPDHPEDPYDSSDDFKYERLEQYGWKLSFQPFGASEEYILTEGFNKFYVADMEVDEKTEHMINIRTLEEFLKEKDPDRLRELKELMSC